MHSYIDKTRLKQRGRWKWDNDRYFREEKKNQAETRETRETICSPISYLHLLVIVTPVFDLTMCCFNYAKPAQQQRSAETSKLR